MKHLAALAISALLLSSSGCSQPASGSQGTAEQAAGQVSQQQHAELQERFDALVAELNNRPNSKQVSELEGQLASLTADRDQFALALKDEKKRNTEQSAEFKKLVANHDKLIANHNEFESSSEELIDSYRSAADTHRKLALLRTVSHTPAQLAGIFSGQYGWSSRLVGTDRENSAALVFSDDSGYANSVRAYFDGPYCHYIEVDMSNLDVRKEHRMRRPLSLLLGISEKKYREWFDSRKKLVSLPPLESEFHRMQYHWMEDGTELLTVEPNTKYKALLGDQLGREAKQHHP